MSDALPWYCQEKTLHPTGTPEKQERYLRAAAAHASPEADQYVTGLKKAEARGVQLSPTDRMSAGYINNTRKAAAMLEAGDPSGNGPSVSAGEMTPEQRIARGYGGAA